MGYSFEESFLYFDKEMFFLDAQNFVHKKRWNYYPFQCCKLYFFFTTDEPRTTLSEVKATCAADGVEFGVRPLLQSRVKSV